MTTNSLPPGGWGSVLAPQQPTGPSFWSELGRVKSEEARGLTENLLWQGAAAAKDFGDAAVNIGTTAAKLLGGVEGAISGQGFGAGWDEVSQSFQQTTGTTNPGVMEFGARIGQEVGLGGDTAVGRRTDEMIDKRLGRDAVIGRSIGTVLSFATGPGAMVGRGGAALAKPYAQVAERMMAKQVGRGLGIADKSIDAMVSTGNAWETFAQMARMQGVMGTRQAILQSVGRNANDILSTTAANVAQAYAMSPDDHRLQGVLTAAYMSPFMVPVARIGQAAERAIMEGGLGGAEAAAIRKAVAGFERGEIGPIALKKEITSAVGPGRRFLASAIIAPAIEGTAFMGLDPNAINLAQRWIKDGDMDAAAELGGMLLGTTGGLAIAKYGFPDHLAPMWKAYRPDLNRLDRIYTEAEAAKRAMEAPQEPAKAPEPKPAQSVEGNEKLEAAASEARRQATAAEAMAERYAAAEATVRADYGWAAEPTAAMLRGNWSPSFNPDKSVDLTFGRDHVVTVRRDDAAGVSLQMNGATMKALRDFGLEPSPDSADRSVISPGRIEVRGPLAQKALDDLAMVGALRRMAADRNFERRGFREVQPDLWVDDGTGTYYTPQLDGTYATKDGPVGKWTGTDDMQVVGPSPELWDNPTAAALGEWSAVKSATFPDPLVDAILQEAVMQARTGNSAGARNLRTFFENTRPEQLATELNAQTDRAFAMKLASLGSTTDTPEMAMARGQAPLPPKAEGVQPPKRDDAPYQPPRTAPDTEKAAIADEVARIASENAPRLPAQETPMSAEQTAKMDRRRADVAAYIDIAKPQGIATISTSPQRARALLRWAVKGSNFGKQLQQVVDGTDIKPVTIRGEELVKFAREWNKWATSKKAELGNTAEINSITQSVDQWIADAATQFGVDLNPPSGSRLTQPIQPDQGPAEAGSINPLTAQQRAAVKRGVADVAKQGRDYFFEGEADVVTRAVPGEKLGYEARAGFARGAEIAGEAADLVRPLEKPPKSMRKGVKSALKQESVPVGYEEGTGTVPHWVGVFDGTTQANTAVEKLLHKVGQAYNSFLRRKAVEAGTTRIQSVDGQSRRVPVRDEGLAVQQRWMGADYDNVMSVESRRKAVFERWLKANPDDMTTVIDEETKAVTKRRTTVDDLNAEWLKDQQVQRGSDEAEQAAIEFTRRFKNVAYKEKIDGQVFEMFETSPFEVIRKTVGKQSAQIAANEQWGQNIPAAERKAMLAEHAAEVKAGRPGLPEAVLRNLQKGGAIERVNRFAESAARMGDTSNLKGAVETAQRLVQRVQGGQPVERRGLAKSQVWRDFMAVRSAALSAAGGLRDVFDLMTRLPTMAGLGRTIRAMKAVAGNGRELFQRAERNGAIQRQLGDYVAQEASSWARKFADIAGWPSNFLERVKGVVATAAADDIISNAKAGKVTSSELQMMQDMMRLPADAVMAIREGRISPALEQQFRREFVALVTSKVPVSEGSSFAANPNTRAWFNFVNWFTRRTADNIRALAAVKHHAGASGWTSPQTVRAMRRLLGISLGTAISGVLGNALVQTFTATLAGDPIDDGIKRAWDQLSYAPAATVLSGLKSGFVGGPLTFALGAASNPQGGFEWSSITAPSGVAYTLFNAGHAVAKGDPAAFTEWVTRLGFVPFRTQFKELLFTGLAGWVSDTQPRADASLVRAWERLEGIERPSAPREKDAAFYDALNEIGAIAKQHPGDPKAALQASTEHLRKALGLEKEESVAAAIEGRQLTKHLNLEQRQQLAEFVNDTDRLARIYQHDRTLREMASTVRRTMEGAYPTPWEQDLDLVRQQAAMGAADKWGSVVERALDESVQRMLAGDGIGDQIEGLSEAMSIYGDQIASLFDARTARFLQDPQVDSLTKARRIQRVLRERALDRTKVERKRQAREANAGG